MRGGTEESRLHGAGRHSAPFEMDRFSEDSLTKSLTSGAKVYSCPFCEPGPGP